MADRVIIALTIAASIVLLGVLGSSMNDTMLERVHEQRLQGTMGELRSRLETDLRIGLALPDDQRAQAMVEDAVARTPRLDSVEIDSQGGTVLFNSDRALRGEPVPAAWRDAARADPQGWHVIKRDEHSVGTPLRDPLGETVGYLVWSHRELRESDVASNLLVKTLWIAGCTALLALLIDGLIEHSARSRRRSDLARLQGGVAAGSGDGAIGQATRVLSEAREELARVDQDAQRVAGFVP